MLIPARYRGFYPIDWPQLSAAIQFGRAGGTCEQCGRPHGQRVHHLGDGRWFDATRGYWRDGDGRRVAVRITKAFALVRTTWVYLATAHRNHDTADNAPANLAAWYQRCHMLHDRPEHLRRRRVTVLRRRAIGDLFRGIYPFQGHSPVGLPVQRMGIYARLDQLALCFPRPARTGNRSIQVAVRIHHRFMEIRVRVLYRSQCRPKFLA